MWILKNSKELTEYIQPNSISSCKSIKTVDFSTLYTTIPHSNLKDRLRELVQLCFMKKRMAKSRYKYLVLILYKKKQNLQKSSLKPISSTCSSFWSTIYLLCLVGVVFNRPMGTNCNPLLADLFFYSYEADYIQRLLKKNEKKLAQSFNYIYIAEKLLS